MKRTILTTFALIVTIACSYAQKDKMRLSDPAVIERNKAAIAKGDFEYKAAYDALIREANKKLTMTPVSVMDKPEAGPSGNKHDYLSKGPYWWPNPATADGLPYIRRDGEVNREARDLDDVKLKALSSATYTLGIAYAYTGEEKYAEKLAQLIRVWFINPDTRMEPNMDYAQVIMGHNNNRGRGTGMIDGYGWIRMLDAVAMVDGSKSFSKKDKEELKKWFSDYVTWSLESENGKDEAASKNNHGNAYDSQLIRFALFAGREDVAREVANNFAKNRLFTQIQPDGSQPLELERAGALHYSVFSLMMINDFAASASTLGIDIYGAKSEDGRSIPNAINFLIPYIGKPLSAWPYSENMGWDNAVSDLVELLYKVQTKYPEYAQLAKDNKGLITKSNIIWLLY